LFVVVAAAVVVVVIILFSKIINFWGGNFIQAPSGYVPTWGACPHFTLATLSSWLWS